LPHDFSPEQRELRKTLRSLGQQEISVGSRDRDRDAASPEALVARLAELGLLGITVPERYGGLGLSAVTQALAIEEVAYADASLGSILGGHYLGMDGLCRYGTAEQQEHYLPRLAKGDERAAFALTEPQAGSDIGAIRSAARADGNTWIITGRKVFISSAREAGVMLLFAKTDTNAGFRGISAFIVRTDAPGITYSQPLDKSGMRGEHAYEVTLEDVRLPQEALLGAAGAGGKIALEILNGARIDTAAIANGIGMRALQLAVDYAATREQFGQPIREFQAVQLSLAQIDVAVEVARAVTYRAAALRDSGGAIRRAASLAKYVASENCFLAVDRALQIHGGYGYMRESEIERLYRDCRILRIYEGTSEIQLLTLARILAKRRDEHGTVN
jgi:alkylation response protein AidB-like acyl-CoA dehydrogenase